MEYHTFTRAMRLINKFPKEDLEKSLESLLLIIEENKSEKIIASNEMRFTLFYYAKSTKKIKQELEDIEKEIEALNEKIKKISNEDLYFKTKSKLIFKLRELQKQKDNLEKNEADYANKLKRNTQVLVDHYLENENTERKYIDVANAIHIIDEAAKKRIYFKQDENVNFKEVYDFLIKERVIKKG